MAVRFGRKVEKIAGQHFTSCCRMNRMRRIGGYENLRKIIRVGLIVMIALSFYFSYMIWLNPTGFNNASTETDTGVNPSVQTYKQKAICFYLYLTWNDEDAIKETNSEAVIREIQEVINEATISDLTLRTYGEEQAFQKPKKSIKGVLKLLYDVFT